MAFTQETYKEIPQNLEEYARQRWPITHKLARVDEGIGCVRFGSYLGGISVEFSYFGDEETPVQRCDRHYRRHLVQPIDGCATSFARMDNIELNIYKYYSERQPKSNPDEDDSQFLERWFEIKRKGVCISLVDKHSNVVGGTFVASVDDTSFARIAMFLRKYEARRQAVEDVMRRLPLPIGQAVLEQM